MQLAQTWTRLDAYLGYEHASSVAVDRQSLGLSAAPVERQHKVGRETLACRIGCHQLAELRDDLRVMAGGQIRFDA